MCGIVGFIGDRDCVPIILKGLANLEYRGYDSAGIVTISDGNVNLRRCQGKIVDLRGLVEADPLSGSLGVGHTRWATHGKPCEENAHPHTDQDGRVVIVHNGIIENYAELRDELEAEGHTFRSETDTEIVAHLIGKYYDGDLLGAVRRALEDVEGSYALGVVCRDEPDVLVAARKYSPLIVGLGEGESYIASDVPAILEYTREVVHLNDGELAVLRRDGVSFYSEDGTPIEHEPMTIEWSAEMAAKDGYSHFMLKEIFEQARAVEDTCRGRLVGEEGEVDLLGELGMNAEELASIPRVIAAACGTAWHACLVGKYMIEELARLPVEVDYAAEFRYREPIISPGTVFIAVSQSGETADTLAAIREAKERGAKVVSICNVVGSSVARDSDAVLYTHAGPEIGVASTKAFTTQLTLLFLLGMQLARARDTISEAAAAEYLEALRSIPAKIDRLLQQADHIAAIADKYHMATNALFLGRGEGYPIALEGALKLKEISYIHAEGYPAAEMKHGPIALIDDRMPVVVLAMRGRRYDKIMSNVQEVKARNGIVIALISEGDEETKAKVDEAIEIPDTAPLLSSIVAVVPLQLLAYYMAVERGCHVDQPRNLAKSVTVE